VTLTFDISTPKIIPLVVLVYPKTIPYTTFEHFGIILFELSCGQTDVQRDMDERFTPARVVGVSNRVAVDMDIHV